MFKTVSRFNAFLLKIRMCQCQKFISTNKNFRCFLRRHSVSLRVLLRLKGTATTSQQYSAELVCCGAGFEVYKEPVQV
jgi:hypothetical protein